jgi:hypothetical protein
LSDKARGVPQRTYENQVNENKEVTFTKDESIDAQKNVDELLDYLQTEWSTPRSYEAQTSTSTKTFFDENDTPNDVKWWFTEN